mmetsp:Transcript_14826/g.30249  ORF Transcript_14826/g.30249 Transcript_14826/m.30249 type:complete len:93 (+) Transcript_14826:199-477(+)
MVGKRCDFPVDHKYLDHNPGNTAFVDGSTPNIVYATLVGYQCLDNNPGIVVVAVALECPDNNPNTGCDSRADHHQYLDHNRGICEHYREYFD